MKMRYREFLRMAYNIRSLQELFPDHPNIRLAWHHFDVLMWDEKNPSEFQSVSSWYWLFKAAEAGEI